jgi:hypothetical protein
MAGIAHSADDDLGIRTALRDYFEGWFDGDPARMESALHPDLAKRGVRAETAGREVDSMTADQMVGWTRDGEGVRERPPSLEIRIEVLDVHHEIATALVRSTVYIEYAHLVRTQGRWQVLNTIYMRTPRPS